MFSAVAYADTPTDADSLTMNAAQVGSISAEPVGNETVYVPLNGTTTLQVNASSTDGEVNYQWYGQKYYENENGSYYNFEPVADATESNYTTDQITKYSQYYCEVSDIYGNTCLITYGY